MPFTYEYPHPAVTVDCIIFALHEDELKVLLIRRSSEPHRGCWALPGGFVEIDESIETAALRELNEETGIKQVFLEQLYTFGEPKRDPRERVISIAYYSVVKLNEHALTAGSDAVDAGWFSIRRLPRLAFDHATVMAMAIKRLQGKVVYAPIIFELLPTKFKLPQLQKVYELILERPLDKRNFRKKILGSGIVTPLNQFATNEPGRPAKLYKFDRKKFQKMQEHGFEFEIKPDSPRKKWKV